MKKRTKKILALLLAIVMAISLMPIAALAEETGEKTGEVAAVVYGPTFTKLLRSGTTLKASEILTELADAATKAKEDGAVIPEVEIVLTNQENGEKYLMQKSDTASFADSLGFELKTSSLLGDIINTILNGILNGSATNTIAQIGRGYAYEVYSTGEIPEGTYSAYIKEIKDEGYAIKQEEYRTINDIVVENKDGKPTYIGEASSFGDSQKIGVGWFSKTYEYEISFPGYWITKKPIGFKFSNQDVVGTGINGNEFTLVNRDQVLDILSFMKALGKETFDTVLANLQNEDVFDFAKVVELHTQLINTENGTTPIDMEVARELVNTYLALLTGIDVWNEVLHSGLVLPAIHTATSATVDDVDGIVEFNEDTNVTLTWAFDQMLKLIDLLPEDNQAVQLFNKVIEILEPLKDKINDEGYDLIYYGSGILGENVPQILGEKMPSGNYLMFQTGVENEDYQRNLLAYTLNITWKNADWLYVTVADLGLVGPYVMPAFYDFVRNTTFEGPVARSFKVLSRGYEFASDATLYNVEITENIRQALMTGSLDMNDENDRALQGAYTAFIANATYNALGLDRVFNTRVALLKGFNDYLVGNQNTALNLMDYVNAQAKRAKSVYAGYVNEDWVFYNLDTSPTTTATKLIDKSTKDIAAAFPEGSERQAGIKQNGETASKIVGAIGQRIEATNKAILAKVKETATKVLGGIFEQVKTGVETVAKNLFTSIIGNLFEGNNTANA